MPLTDEELRDNYWLAVVVYLCGYGPDYTGTDPDTGAPWKFTLVDDGTPPHPNPSIGSWDVDQDQPTDLLMRTQVDMSMIDAAHAAIFGAAAAAERKERPAREAKLRALQEAREEKRRLAAEALRLAAEAEALRLEAEQLEISRELKASEGPPALGALPSGGGDGRPEEPEAADGAAAGIITIPLAGPAPEPEPVEPSLAAALAGAELAAALVEAKLGPRAGPAPVGARESPVGPAGPAGAQLQSPEGGQTPAVGGGAAASRSRTSSWQDLGEEGEDDYSF